MCWSSSLGLGVISAVNTLSFFRVWSDDPPPLTANQSGRYFRGNAAFRDTRLEDTQINYYCCYYYCLLFLMNNFNNIIQKLFYGCFFMVLFIIQSSMKLTYFDTCTFFEGFLNAPSVERIRGLYTPRAARFV